MVEDIKVCYSGLCGCSGENAVDRDFESAGSAQVCRRRFGVSFGESLQFRCFFSLFSGKGRMF